MAPLENANYQNILTQAQGQLNQLLSLTEGGQTGSGASSYINSVWGLAGNTEQLINGDDSQKASAIQNIVNKLTDLISNLGTGEAGKANKRVKENDKKIADNDNQAQKTSMTIDAKLQEIMNQCEAGSKSIEDAIKQIQELGGDNGEIGKVQEQLDEQLQIIEDNKQVLNDDSANSKDRHTALKNILGAASAINTLVANVNEILGQIEEQNAVVENASTQIADLSTGAAEILAEGTRDIQENMAKTGQLQGENTIMASESVVKDTAGATQIAIGEAMSSGPQAIVAGATGAKYIMSGNDKVNAGATLMSGSVQGLQKLTQSVGSMGGYLTEFANFANGIGQFAEGATELVGKYDTTVNSMITAIGSWDVVTDANNQLQAYVEEYSGGLEETVGEEEQNKGQDLEVGYTAENNIFKKFEFDTNIFKAASK